MASVGDIIQVTCQMLLAGQTMLNVYHAVVKEPTSDSDVVDDLIPEVDSVQAEVAGVTANDLAYTFISLKNISTAVDLGIHAWQTLTTGGGGAEYLPLGVAGLVTLPTELLKTRGRKFYPGLTETDQADSLFDVDVTSALIGVGALLIVPWFGTQSGNEYEWGVPNRLGAFSPFVAHSVQNIPSYQRRRKQGVGS